MLRGLGRQVREGVPCLNPDLSVSVWGSEGQLLHHLPPMALTAGGIGVLYERVVALAYEAEGYEVDQRGRLGFGDRGVDLVCERPDERVFVQCKFSTRPFSVRKVEQILYNASSFVKGNLGPGANFFDLVVPFENCAFPVSRARRSEVLRANLAKSAFLPYNSLQSAVKLRIREVELAMPPS